MLQIIRQLFRESLAGIHMMAGFGGINHDKKKSTIKGLNF